jgi:hypothetical protein
MERPLRVGILGAMGLLVALVSPGSAQWRGLREVSPSAGPRAGIDLLVGVPQGQFQQFVQSVGGIGGFITFPVDRSGSVGIRVDGSILFHGGRCVSGGCALETSSYLGSLRVGPELTLGTGRVRLYGLATAGFSYFGTDVVDHYGCDCYSIFGGYDSYGSSSTLLDDFTGSWEAGGGVRVALGRRGKVALDLGARYQGNGRATYLNDASVTPNGDGTFTISPIRTAANLVLFHLGVSIGLD